MYLTTLSQLHRLYNVEEGNGCELWHKKNVEAAVAYFRTQSWNINWRYLPSV